MNPKPTVKDTGEAEPTVNPNPTVNEAEAEYEAEAWANWHSHAGKVVVDMLRSFHACGLSHAKQVEVLMEMVQEGGEFLKLMTNLAMEEPWKYCDQPTDRCEPQLEALVNAAHVWSEYLFAPTRINPDHFRTVMGVVPFQCAYHRMEHLCEYRRSKLPVHPHWAGAKSAGRGLFLKDVDTKSERLAMYKAGTVFYCVMEMDTEVRQVQQGKLNPGGCTLWLHVGHTLVASW